MMSIGTLLVPGRSAYFRPSHSSRKGNTMSDPVNATPRRALVVIDVQNDYDGGNLATQHPPFRDSVVNVERAMDAATAAGVKVVVVKQMAPEMSPIFALGSHGGELHPEIARRGRNHYVEKNLPSA